MKRIAQTVLSMMAIAGAACLSPVAAEDEIDAPLPLAEGVEACLPGDGGASFFAHVSNIREIEGNIRAQVYGSDPADFLEKGKKLVRIDVPVAADVQGVCVPLPAPGRYALVIMHDRNENGKADFFTEGFGFSNNPKLKLAPPDAEEVMIEAPAGVTELAVRLKYVFGSDEEQKKKRRALRRR